MLAELPDVLRTDDGSAVRSPPDWSERRRELLATCQREMFGRLPPAAPVDAVWLMSHVLRNVNDVVHDGYRLTVAGDPPIAFMLDLYRPRGDGPFPILINGDGCWRYVTDEVLGLLSERGYALAQFDRTQIMPDIDANHRDCDLVRRQPADDFGAIAAWAWGYQRVVDYLLTHDKFDAAKIGATDERIALVHANGSGCGGAGCLRYSNADAETLDRINRQFPFWFSRRFHAYAGREQDLPIDAHDLKALIAPRHLLMTEAFADRWANPAGTLLTHEAARPAFDLLDAADNIAIHFREGEHRHDMIDWRALVDFADRQWFGRSVDSRFNDDEHAARLKAEPLYDAAGNEYEWPH